MDTANRNFLLLAVLAVGAYVLLGFWGCEALMGVLSAVETGQFTTTSRLAVWPGAVLAVADLAIATAGLLSLHRQLVATERLARWVNRRRIELPDDLVGRLAGRRLRSRLDLVDSDDLITFTYGFLRPRIVISTGLLRTTTRHELDAVLEHEAYHVRNLDPLKMAAARALAAAFFFLPVLRDLRDRYLLARELAADRRSADRYGVQPLAAALARTSSPAQSFSPAAGAALTGDGLLPPRVEQLETGAEPPAAPIPRTQMLVTILTVAGLAGLLVASRATSTGVHLHAPPMGASLTLSSMVMTGLCLTFWTWVGWRIVRWLRARPAQ